MGESPAIIRIDAQDKTFYITNHEYLEYFSSLPMDGFSEAWAFVFLTGLMMKRIPQNIDEALEDDTV